MLCGHSSAIASIIGNGHEGITKICIPVIPENIAIGNSAIHKKPLGGGILNFCTLDVYVLREIIESERQKEKKK